jgi:hypothetical protein
MSTSLTRVGLPNATRGRSRRRLSRLDQPRGMRRPRTDSEKELLDERRDLFVEFVALVLVVVLALFFWYFTSHY